MDKARFATMHDNAVENSTAQYVVRPDLALDGKFIALVHKDLDDVPTVAVANVYVVDKQDGSSTHHVAVAFDGEQMYVSCDDNGINGTRTDQESRIETALASAAVEGGLTEAQTERLYQELTNSVGVTEKDTGCHFWSTYTKTAGEEACQHVGAVLEEKGLGLWDEMAKLHAERMNELLEKSKPLSVEDVDVQLAKDIRDLAFATPILIEGERGVGKTFEAKMFAKKNDFGLVVAGGHDGVESADLLGHYVPGRDAQGQSTLYWKDGPVSEAFRAASEGRETVLVIDEMLRIPQRQLNVLLTALSADETDTFELRTGKMSGDGKEEVLRAPQSKLAVIATTNVGVEYAVDEIDPALMDRFTTVYKETTLEDVKAIINSAANKAGLTKEDAANTVKFWSTMRNLEQRGAIKSAPSVRTLCMAMKLAPRKGLEWALGTQAGKMVTRESNGAPSKTETDIVKKAIAAAFAGEKSKDKGKGKGPSL